MGPCGPRAAASTPPPTLPVKTRHAQWTCKAVSLTCAGQEKDSPPSKPAPLARARVFIPSLPSLRRYLHKLGKPTNFPVSVELAAELETLTLEQIQCQFRCGPPFVRCVCFPGAAERALYRLCLVTHASNHLSTCVYAPWSAAAERAPYEAIPLHNLVRRQATYQAKQMQLVKYPGSTSAYRGVSFDARDDSWRVNLHALGRECTLESTRTNRRQPWHTMPLLI